MDGAAFSLKAVDHAITQLAGKLRNLPSRYHQTGSQSGTIGTTNGGTRVAEFHLALRALLTFNSTGQGVHPTIRWWR